MGRSYINWDYESVKHFIEIKSGSKCKLLSTEYIKKKNKLKIMCKCGNIFEVTFDKFESRNKRQCNECSNITNWNIETVKNFVEVESNSNCKLLSTEYINIQKSLHMQCGCGNFFNTSFAQFKTMNKRSCNCCSKKNASDKIRLQYDDVKEFIENKNCKLLSKKYVNYYSKLKIACSCGEVFYVSFNNFKSGQTKCKHCSKLLIRENLSLNFEDVKNYVETDSNSGCKLLSNEYINNNTKMKFKCPCGNVFNTSFGKFKHGNKQRCNNCSSEITKNKLKHTYEYVKNFVEENSDCVLLSEEYINNGTTMDFSCGCGNEFSTTFSLFKDKNQRQCRNCGIKIRGRSKALNFIDVEDFIKNNSNCILLSTYIDSYKKIKLLCECGNTFYVAFNNFKYGNKRTCNKCSIDRAIELTSLSIEQVKEFIETSISDWKILKLLSDDYTNHNTEIIVQDESGYKYNITLSRIKSSYRKKNGMRPFSPVNSFAINNMQIWLNDNGYKFTILSNEYNDSKDKVLIECENGHQVYINFNNIKCLGRGCSICSESKGELTIRNLLESKNIEYERQYTFNDLKGQYDYLRFDFAVFLKDNEISFLVEYDGEFHFKPIFDEKRFQAQKRNDSLKNKYCKRKNIKLVRIPYWQFDKIEEIVNKWINFYN